MYKTLLNVRQWRSGLFDESFEGSSEKMGDEFSFEAGARAHYSKQKLVEAVPNEKVVWDVTDSNFSFVEKKNEWVGTRLIFDISKDSGETKFKFTHEGLVPEMECYESCSSAWSQYIQKRLPEALRKRTDG
ncbi:SRPBCC domain-containing protein [Desertivirga brevis]|uniref:SRPBCC domain-containing protein n=1 Tax=Desertivirga brevis TaxID=2810310 RepID=UPI001A95C078